MYWYMLCLNIARVGCAISGNNLPGPRPEAHWSGGWDMENRYHGVLPSIHDWYYLFNLGERKLVDSEAANHMLQASSKRNNQEHPRTIWIANWTWGVHGTVIVPLQSMELRTLCHWLVKMLVLFEIGPTMSGSLSEVFINEAAPPSNTSAGCRRVGVPDLVAVTLLACQQHPDIGHSNSKFDVKLLLLWEQGSLRFC